MKRILTYGTFDLLHYGHIRLLQRAKALVISKKSYNRSIRRLFNSSTFNR